MGQCTFSLAAHTWINKDSPNTNYASATRSKSPAVLRFTSSVNLARKKITKAVLSSSGRFIHSIGSGVSTTFNWTFRIASYSTEALYSSLTYNNYTNLGVAGESIEYSVSAYAYGVGTEYTSLNYSNIDITNIFVNAVRNNVFEMIYTFSSDTELDSASILVEYEDSVQAPPTPAFPVSTYIRENETITFSWGWNSGNGAAQKSVELAYKLKTAASWTTVALTQSNYFYKLDGGLPKGEYIWKIKGTNEDNETSVYSSEVGFNVVGKPAVPVIQEPENKTLTKIIWGAEEQVAYELKLIDANGVELVHDTFASSETVYSPNMFLKGTYTVGIAYCNISGFWSEMAYKTFVINPVSPSKTITMAITDGNNVRIIFNKVDNANLAIMRCDNAAGDYKIIAVMDPDVTEYVDTTVIPGINYKYVVRSYAEGYSDSDSVEIAVSWSGAMLNDGANELHLKLSTDRFASYGKKFNREVALTNYSGRAYALAEHGEFRKDTITRQFYVSEKEAQELERFIDADCYYRDEHGNAYKCCVTDLEYSNYMDDGYEITLQVTRLFESEVEVNV